MIAIVGVWVDVEDLPSSIREEDLEGSSRLLFMTDTLKTMILSVITVMGIEDSQTSEILWNYLFLRTSTQKEKIFPAN